MILSPYKLRTYRKKLIKYFQLKESNKSAGVYCKEFDKSAQRHKEVNYLIPSCQICHKKGHAASQCWNRYSNKDDNYRSVQQLICKLCQEQHHSPYNCPNFISYNKTKPSHDHNQFDCLEPPVNRHSNSVDKKKHDEQVSDVGNYCDKIGHSAQECYSLARDKKLARANESENYF